MGWFDELLVGVGDFLASDAGGALVGAGVDLLAPAAQEAIYGNADPNALLSPEQLEAIRRSNEARAFQLKTAREIGRYGTPEAQSGIVREQIARATSEADLARVRQVSRGVRTPFTSNREDNIDPIIRRALEIADPTSRALNVKNMAAATAGGVPSQFGPPDIGSLARAEDLFNQGKIEQTIGSLLTPETINLIFGNNDEQVSGFFSDTGGGSSDLTYNPHGNPF